MTRFDFGAARARIERLLQGIDVPHVERADEVMARRARVLAEPEAATEARRPLLRLRRAGRAYAVDLEQATAAAPARLLPLPGLPSFVPGVVAHGGTMVAAIDLAALLGTPGDQAVGMTHVTVLRAGALVGALLSDGTPELHEVAEAELSADLATSERGFVKAVAADGTVVLDVPALLQDPRLVVEDEGA